MAFVDAVARTNVERTIETIRQESPVQDVSYFFTKPASAALRCPSA